MCKTSRNWIDQCERINKQYIQLLLLLPLVFCCCCFCFRALTILWVLKTAGPRDDGKRVHSHQPTAVFRYLQCATVIGIFISWTIISFLQFFFLAFSCCCFMYQCCFFFLLCNILHGVMYGRYYWKLHTQIRIRQNERQTRNAIANQIGAVALYSLTLDRI